eukprot:1245797-Amphidinium_carterae.3
MASLTMERPFWVEGTTFKSLSESEDTSLLQTAQETIVQSYATRSMGVLLGQFHEEQNITKLRAKIQAEVRVLRTNGLNEKSALPPLLLDKVLRVLRCQT